MSTVLAVDFGGSKTALALVNEQGTVHRQWTVAASRSVEESLAPLHGLSHTVTAAGVILPGIYTPSTGKAWCPNLWGSDEVAVRDALHAILDVPVSIDSDRTGYVLGESWLGVARGLRHVVFVALGTGIGVGILSNGIVVRGAHGVAGAAGWFALTPDWKENYARTGCWEGESAGPAIARLAKGEDAGRVVASAREGDANARGVLDRAARFIGMGVANLISVLDPEMVVLGGGLGAGAADLILDLVREEAKRWAQPIAFGRCRIEVTRLGESAGVLGAARLALDAAAGHMPQATP